MVTKIRGPLPRSQIVQLNRKLYTCKSQFVQFNRKLDKCKESVSATFSDFLHFNVRLGKNL